MLHERNPNSPDFTDVSIDWTDYQEDQARHNAWELHTELNKITGSYADVHETHFLKGCSPFKKKQDVFLSTVVFLAHDGIKFLLSAGQEDHTTDQQLIGNPTVPQWTRSFTSRKSALGCTGSWWKIRLRYCLLDACAMRCGILTLGTDNLVRLVAFTQQKATPSVRHDLAGENLDAEVEETMLKLLEPCSESLIDDDAVLVKKTTLARKKSWVRP